MMQIPPPSNSLLSAMFSNDATTNASGEGGDTSGSQKYNSSHSSEKRPSELAGEPPLALPTASSRRVRYDPSVPLKENQQPSSVRRTDRPRSPPQKIQRTATTIPSDDNNKDQENLRRHSLRDEDLRVEAESGTNHDSIGGCFSYRTKDYEKASLQMLERMRKSRSFEKQHSTPTPYRPWNSCYLPESSTMPESTSTSTNMHRNRNSEPDSSLKYAEAVEDSDSDYYIGSHSEEDFLAASTPSLAVLSSYGDFDPSDELSCDEEDEIFELDL